mgnify:CR=1 FL=1
MEFEPITRDVPVDGRTISITVMLNATGTEYVATCPDFEGVVGKGSTPVDAAVQIVNWANHADKAHTDKEG